MAKRWAPKKHIQYMIIATNVLVYILYELNVVVAHHHNLVNSSTVANVTLHTTYYLMSENCSQKGG